MQNRNKIISVEEFKTILNKELFDGFIVKLLQKIADKPARYTGLFRPTKAKTKLIQNITQSHEIKFGDALEIIFEKYFEKTGFTLLDKKLIKTENTDELNIDQLLLINSTIYLIEQKIRDDHDSTKKRGQFENFEKKYLEVSKIYKNRKIMPIMWFIDDSIIKNKSFYLEEMNKMANKYKCNPQLFYGEELFNAPFKKEIWEEAIDYLVVWKENLQDMPELNFDMNAIATFEEIKDLKPNIFRKIFANKKTKEQILPILFPDCKVLKLLVEYFDSKQKKIYKNLSSEIATYIAQYNK